REPGRHSRTDGADGARGRRTAARRAAAGSRGRRAGAGARRAGAGGARRPRAPRSPTRSGVPMAYEAVIGLECHIQLATGTKMFCGCPAEFGAPANTNVCPVCLGLPGALPVTNRAAIDAALRLGLALGCEVREESVFARKNYFYPDMPKNYQISQYDRPLCEGGALPLRIGEVERSFDLIRIHVEEDTGKSFHPEKLGDRRISRVDFNRA